MACSADTHADVKMVLCVTLKMVNAIVALAGPDQNVIQVSVTIHLHDRR